APAVPAPAPPARVRPPPAYPGPGPAPPSPPPATRWPGAEDKGHGTHSRRQPAGWPVRDPGGRGGDRLRRVPAPRRDLFVHPYLDRIPVRGPRSRLDAGPRRTGGGPRTRRVGAADLPVRARLHPAPPRAPRPGAPRPVGPVPALRRRAGPVLARRRWQPVPELVQ